MNGGKYSKIRIVYCYYPPFSGIRLYWCVCVMKCTNSWWLFSPVTSTPHNIRHRLIWKTADLKLVPTVWKPKKRENTNVEEIFLEGKTQLALRISSLWLSKEINSTFGFSSPLVCPNCLQFPAMKDVPSVNWRGLLTAFTWF